MSDHELASPSPSDADGNHDTTEVVTVSPLLLTRWLRQGRTLVIVARHGTHLDAATAMAAAMAKRQQRPALGR